MKTLNNFILLLACFFILLGIRLYVNQPLSGDEPHYLLMVYSLSHDKDLNLKNNYLNKDLESLYPNLSPVNQIGNLQVENNSIKWYSIHGVGLPILLLPGFLIAGELGAIITMVFISTVVLWLTWIWVFDVTKNKGLATLSSIILLTCYSFNGLAGYIYPDIIIAGITLAALIIIHRYSNNLLYQFIFGLIIGFMILVHFKSLAVALPLFLVLIYKQWSKHRKIPWVSVVGFLPLALFFFISTYVWFGVWNPATIYSGLSFTQASVFFIVSGILFDSMRGILVNNPILLLIPLGLPIWFKSNREKLLIAAFVALPSILILANFGEWNGGDSPTGRYIIDILPIFIPAIAYSISALKKLKRSLPILLYLITFFITVDFVLIKRAYVRFDTRSPLFIQIERHLGVALDRFLPTFSTKTTITSNHGLIKIILCYVALFMLFYFGLKLSKSFNNFKVSDPARK